MEPVLDTGSIIRQLSTYLTPLSDNVQEICRNSSIAYMNALKIGTTWAVKMWDSTAKLQTGLLTGNLNSLGNYDECLKIMNIRDKAGEFHGQHCLATFEIKDITAADAMGNVLKEIMKEEKDINIGLGSVLSKGLHWGFCIPSSCSYKDLQQSLSDYMGNSSGIDVSVSKADCHDVRKTSLSVAEIVFLWIIGIYLLLTFLSTVYEGIKNYLSNKYQIPVQVNEALKTLHEYQSARDNPDSGIRISVYDQPGTSGISTSQSVSSTVDTSKKKVDSNPSTRPNGESASKSIHGTESQSSSLTLFHVQNGLLLEGSTAHLRNLGEEADNSYETSFETENGGSEEYVQAQENVKAKTEDVIEELNAEDEIALIAPDDTSPLPELNDTGDFLDTFSLISNWNRLFSFVDSPAVLHSLNGLKFFSMCWVLLGHSCFIMESIPALNYVNVKHFTDHWTAILIMNASLAVDTFIVITGVLISYHFLKDMRKSGIYHRGSNRIASTGLTKRFFFKYLPIYYCHRYIRLTPALLMMVFFQLSIYKRFGSGPLWDYGYGNVYNACHKNWWATLTYVENYVASDRLCLPQSWYLMVDMQLYLLSPFILVLLMAWSRQRSLFAIVVLTSLGITCSFLVNYLMKIPAGLAIGDLTNWSLRNRFDYQAAYTRFGPWMIGIGVGYLLHSYRKHGRFVFKIRWWARILCWCMAIVTLLFPLFTMQPFRKHSHKNSNILYSAMFNSLYHSMWALGIGWIIIACECNFGGFIQSMLSSKIFQPLSRLTYGIFLVHLPLMTIRALSTRVPIYVDGFHVISSFLGDLALSSIIAIILHLLVEMPIIRLYKLITFNLKNPVRLLSTTAGQAGKQPLSPNLQASRQQPNGVS